MQTVYQPLPLAFYSICIGRDTSDCFPFPHRHDSYCWHHQWVTLLCQHCERKPGYFLSSTKCQKLSVGFHSLAKSSSCFYDGLDAYALTLLQLSFPIYLWLLAFGIIIANRHFSFMNGRNIVHVLVNSFSPLLHHHSCWSVFHYCRREQWNQIYCLAE